MAINFKGAHFPKGIILMGVRWYLAYPLSTRHVEELMEERGVELEHATINRWVIKYSPLLAEAFHRRKRPGWFCQLVWADLVTEQQKAYFALDAHRSGP